MAGRQKAPWLLKAGAAVLRPYNDQLTLEFAPLFVRPTVRFLQWRRGKRGRTRM